MRLIRASGTVMARCVGPNKADTLNAPGKISDSLFHPKDIPDLAVWYDASDTSTLFQNSNGTTAVSANSDPVGYWGDKSGNGFHLIQATAAARPLWKTGVFGDAPAILGDGTDDELVNTAYNLTTTSGLTLYVVLKSVTTAAFKGIFSGWNGVGSATTNRDSFLFETWTDGGSGPRWLLDRFDTDTDGMLANQVAAGSAFTNSQIVTGCIDLGNKLGRMWVNGGAQNTEGFATAISCNPTLLSAFKQGHGGAWWNGYLREVLMYRGVHTVSQITAVNRYLAAKAGSAMTITTAS